MTAFELGVAPATRLLQGTPLAPDIVEGILQRLELPGLFPRRLHFTQSMAGLERRVAQAAPAAGLEPHRIKYKKLSRG